MAVYSSSCPSGHAMTAGVVYLTLAAVLIRVETRRRLKAYLLSLAVLVTVAVGASRVYLGVHRSEEHTSELQSLMRNSYAVFCLKKNTTVTPTHTLDNTKRHSPCPQRSRI